MGKIKKIRRVFFPGIHLKRWLNIEHLKKNRELIKDAFSNATQAHRQTPDASTTSDFESRRKELGLTHEQLNQKALFSKHLSYLYASMGSALFLYGLYILAKPFFLAGITCIVFSLLLFVYAFKENIFYFQITQRQLKVSIHQWAKQLFSGKSS